MKKRIIWFTGLSGAGKTTLAKALIVELKKKYNIKKKYIIAIDGDKFRKKRKKKNIFSKKNIIENNISIINYIKKIKPHFKYIVVSVISPLRVTRNFARKIFGKSYFEVYVSCNLKVLNKRDTKGLYLKAKKNELKNLIGVNSKIKYETSKYKKIIINTAKLSKKNSIKKLIKNLKLNNS